MISPRKKMGMVKKYKGGRIAQLKRVRVVL